MTGLLYWVFAGPGGAVFQRKPRVGAVSTSIEGTDTSNGLRVASRPSIDQSGVPVCTAWSVTKRADDRPLLALTRIRTRFVPATVGVPLSRPAADRLTPVGRVPEVTLQVNGPAPCAVSWRAYAVPT